MRVPVRRLPQTNISQQQQGYARAAPGVDLTPITGAINEFRNQLQDEQRDRQRVAANRRLMREVNELQSDFEERRRNPEISPIDFADTTDTAYQERHQALIAELQGENFDADVLEDLDQRLGAVRQGLYERGLGHQIAALTDRAFNEADELGVSASQYVAANPDGYASAEAMLRDSISIMPDLTEAQREAKIDEQLGILRNAGARALAIQNPELIIQHFDPQGLTAPFSASGAASGVTLNTEGMDTARTEVASTLSAGGLSPQVVAGFLGNFEIEGGYEGATGDNGTASGIAQWREERRANFRRQFGKDPHQATAVEQAQFVLWELANPAEAGMTATEVAAIRNARTAEEAAALIDEYYERSSGEHRSRRTEAAAGFARTVQPVDIPPSEVAYDDERPPAEVSQITSPADALTGNPLLDALNGPERLQALSWAREQLNRVSVSRRAEMDVTIGNITAEAMQNGGEIATPLPTEQDVLSVYGPVEGPQRWAQIQQSIDTGRAVETFRTQSAESIQQSLDTLEPTPGSPTYQTELQIYEAAQRAAQQLLTERRSDPAAYALRYFPSVGEAARRGTQQYYAELDRVYETLGIDANRAPLLTAEASQRIVQDYQTMTPTQRLQFMRENYLGMGEDRFRRFTSNMEGTTAQDDARIFMLLGTYPGASHQANVYRQVLEGREYMAQDPARRPSAELVNQQFRAEGLNAITNLNADASRAIQEAAAALYVVRGGNPQQIDRTLYRESLATALGGNLPANMRRGEVQDYTILPPGVNERSFENWMEGQTWQSLTEMSVERRPPRLGDLRTLVLTQDIIDDGVFVMVSPGRYMIKMASDGRPLMTSTGRPFLVNIRAGDVNRVSAQPTANRLQVGVR